MSQDTAGQEPVKKPEDAVNPQAAAPASTTPVEVDPEAEMAKLLAENKRLAEERENYRKGMLKAKGKLSEDVEPEIVEDEDKMRRIIREEMAQTNYAKVQQQLEEHAIKLARENKELKKSLANRSQLSSNQVTSQEAHEVRDTSISPEKERELLSRFSGDEETKKRKLAQWKQNRFKK